MDPMQTALCLGSSYTPGNSEARTRKVVFLYGHLPQKEKWQGLLFLFRHINI